MKYVVIFPGRGDFPYVVHGPFNTKEGAEEYINDAGGLVGYWAHLIEPTLPLLPNKGVKP